MPDEHRKWIEHVARCTEAQRAALDRFRTALEDDDAHIEDALSAAVHPVLVELDRLRAELQWFADGEWVEDDPLKARDRAREALRG